MAPLTPASGLWPPEHWLRPEYGVHLFATARYIPGGRSQAAALTQVTDISTRTGLKPSKNIGSSIYMGIYPVLRATRSQLENSLGRHQTLHSRVLQDRTRKSKRVSFRPSSEAGNEGPKLFVAQCFGF